MPMFCLMATANTSICIANKSEDRGSPCLVPLSILIVLDIVPFVFILEVGLLYIAFNHEQNVLSKPILLNTKQT